MVSVSVTLDSKAAAPMRLQAEVLQWRQTVKGKDVYDETADLLVTPPVAELKPGQRQIFRLALRGARSAQDEMAYRLILEDISELVESVKLATNMNIDFRMRYDLPVMVAPLNAVSNRLQWKPCVTSGRADSTPAAACIRLLNAGNRRVKVESVTVAGDGWQHALRFKDGQNVLSGAEREWRIPLQAAQSGAPRSVQVQTARGETLQAETDGF